jgi:hypothetical protein
MRRGSRVLIAALCAAALNVTVSVAPSTFPASWHRYLWLSWPASLVLVVAVYLLERGGAGPDGTGDVRQAAGALRGRQRHDWIGGVLDQSLGRIALGMDAIDQGRPWRLVAARRGSPPRRVEPGTPISAIYDDFAYGTLILGAPGAGKTTTLLELLRDLLDRSAADPATPLPVLLNLASWSADRLPLDEWVAQEIRRQYRIPTRYARAWLAGDRLALLLDGLDEVAPDRRADCVAAINRYQHAHDVVPLVVCCRTEDYRAIGAELDVPGTLSIRPLDRDQVTGFLTRAGDAAAGARAVLDADPELWNLIDSPLMLSILTLAYRGTPGDHRFTGSTGERRDQLFAVYIRKMLLQQRPSTRYDPAATIRYLGFLAKQLTSRSQTVFHVDLIDRYWAPPLSYFPIGRRTSWLFGTAGVILLAVLGTVAYGWRGGIAVGALGTTFGVVSFDHVDSATISTFRSDRADRPTRPADLVAAESAGFFLGTLARPQHRARVLIVAVAAAVELGPLLGWATRPSGIIGYGVAGGAAVALAGLLYPACSWGVVNLPARGTGGELPSPQARAVLRGGTVTAVVIGLFTGTVAGLVTGLTLGGRSGLRFGALMAVAAALYGLTCLGLVACAEQAQVRIILRRRNLFPMPCRGLLDHAASCLLLRSTGDGYIFVHRSLQEFFADLVGDVRLIVEPESVDERIAELLAVPDRTRR